MTTLIERLRSGTDGSHLWWAKLHVEAADEIERLTREKEALREALREIAMNVARAALEATR